MQESDLVAKPQLIDTSCKGFCRAVYFNEWVIGNTPDLDTLHTIVHQNEAHYFDTCPGEKLLKNWIKQFEMEIS